MGEGQMSARKILYFGSNAVLQRAITRALIGGRDIGAESVSTADRAVLFRMLDECAIVLVDAEIGSQLANALDLCSQLRRARPSIYVVLLTGRGTSKAIVAALNAGADDCFEKTAAIGELAARIRVALRRSSPPPATPLSAGLSASRSDPNTFDSEEELDRESGDEGTDSEPLLAAARQMVGSLGLTDAQRLVRRAMAKEALTRFDGNRHAVARTLQVDRRYILKLIEEDPEIDPRSASRVPPFTGSEGE
jgi:DNA-binding response OmpR family regulator